MNFYKLYQLRWLHGLGILCLLYFIVTTFFPAYVHYIKISDSYKLLIIAKHDLTEKIHIQNHPALKEKTISNETYLSRWRALAAKHHIMIDSTQITSLVNVKISNPILKVRITATTDFDHWLAWLRAIKLENLPIYLVNCELTLSDQINISAEFVLASLHKPHEKHSAVYDLNYDVANVFDPFCKDTENEIPRAFSAGADWHFILSIFHLKLIAVELSHKPKFALFSWYGRWFWLEENATIGKESATLLSLTNHQAIFLLPNQKKISINISQT